MHAIGVLRKEHRDIDRELVELETIIEDEPINYPNLAHVFKKLCKMWDKHEEKEEEIFEVMEREKVSFPVEKMIFEHRELGVHRKIMENALDSGSEQKIREALHGHGIRVIEKIRSHMNKEEEVFREISLSQFSEKGLKELEEWRG